MIQCPPHGMTKSTDVAVRRISPASPVIAERGTTRCTPLQARTRRPALAGGPSPESRSTMSSLHTPVAATTVRACTSNSVTRLEVPHPYAGDLARVAEQPDRPGAGDDGRAEARRGPGQGRHQSGVVDLAVVVLDRAGDRVLAQRREAPAGRGAGQVPVQRHPAAPRTGAEAGREANAS